LQASAKERRGSKAESEAGQAPSSGKKSAELLDCQNVNEMPSLCQCFFDIG